jgi:DNA-directed RNA polymerase specialized sigma24 family protein
MSHLPQPTEENFGALLEMYILKLRSIDDLQRHPKFCQMLRDNCYRFNFKNFGEVYDPEDLYQDSFMKVNKAGRKLQIEGNILNEAEFAKWLYVVVRSVLRSKDKQLNKARRNKCVRCDKPSEDLNRPAPEIDYDGKYYLSLFLDFTKGHPEEHQRAMQLWLTNFSLREIKEILSDEGYNVSYGTIRNWEDAILKAFKERLGLQTPKGQQKRSRRQSGT